MLTTEGRAVYDNIRKIDMSSFRKLQFRWYSPYYIRYIGGNRTYILETLDRVLIQLLYTLNRVKKFFQLDGIWLEVDGCNELR